MPQVFESTNIKETAEFVDKQKSSKEKKSEKRKIIDENKVERDIHAHRTSFTVGYSPKYSANYDNIDWSK